MVRSLVTHLVAVAVGAAILAPFALRRPAQPTSKPTQAPIAAFAGRFVAVGDSENGDPSVFEISVKDGKVSGKATATGATFQMTSIDGNRVRGQFVTGSDRTPGWLELSQSGDFLVVVLAPPESEYDIVAAHREGANWEPAEEAGETGASK